MDEKQTVRYKSKKFAIRVVKLYQYLCNEKKEYVLSKQLLRCGTSIGANLAESECAILVSLFHLKNSALKKAEQENTGKRPEL